VNGEEAPLKNPHIAFGSHALNDANNLFFGQGLSPEIFDSITIAAARAAPFIYIFAPPCKILLIKLFQ